MCLTREKDLKLVITLLISFYATVSKHNILAIYSYSLIKNYNLELRGAYATHV